MQKFMQMNQNNKFPKGLEVVGSGIIEDGNGRILLVQSPKWNNKWVMPGGHIDPGETIEQGILREIKEETGLSTKSKGIIAHGELIDSKNFHRPAHFIYFDLVCQAQTTNVKLDNKELTDYVWVTPQEALKMDLAESYKETIEDYIKYLISIELGLAKSQIQIFK